MSSVPKICVTCGDPIPPDSRKWRYCSKECYRPTRPASVACPTCGEPIAVGPMGPVNKYCSARCRPKVKGPCEACGKIDILARKHCPRHYQQLRKYGQIISVESTVGFPRTDNPAYLTVHSRLRSKRGNPTDYTCATGCGRTATDWAFDNEEPYFLDERLNLIYHDDLNRYQPMCRSCHKLMDSAMVTSTPSPPRKEADYEQA